MSLAELHELRRRILHEEYEPTVLEMRQAVSAVCAARPTPEEKPAKRVKKEPAKKVDLTDLLSD